MGEKAICVFEIAFAVGLSTFFMQKENIYDDTHSTTERIPTWVHIKNAYMYMQVYVRMHTLFILHYYEKET